MKTTRKHVACPRNMRGISIVESLVALVVISVGMLGIAALYLSSMQAGRTAKLRTQAVNLAASLADRIRANRGATRASYLTATYSGAPALQSCDTAVCLPNALAQDDLARWIADIRNDLPGAATTGTVTMTAGAAPNPADTFLITVTWREAGSSIDYSYSLPLSQSSNL